MAFQDRSQSTHPTPQLRVIVIEDDPVVTSLTVDAIRSGYRGGDVAAVDLEDTALAGRLAVADVCVCSGDSREGEVFATLIRVLRLRPDMPVVVLLPACDAAGGKAAQAIDLGAADVLLRGPGGLAQLPVTIRRIAMHSTGMGYAGRRHHQLRAALAEIEADNNELRSLVARLESLAATDSLTGLLNRRALDAALIRAFAASKRYGHELSCLALDVDGFKGVNDALGHARGDSLLRVLAASIIAECRQSDIAGRLGGDEFVVLLPHTGPTEAAAVAQRLRGRFDREAAALGAEIGAGGRATNLGLSIGVAARFAHGLDSPDAVLDAADGALYQAKRAGRGTVRITGELRRAG